MPMNPPTVTAQEHRVTVINGRPVFYDTPEIKSAKNKLTAHLLRHRPTERNGQGVRLVVKWCFPRGVHRYGEYRITKPAPDTHHKLYNDSMKSTGFWKDDALVCSEICEKFWAEIPGIYISVESIEEI
ncbi:MAG: RusA family crossover junction endodeoxyribonuclease [Clostridiales bacterium]|nr:RusA family crossover junction endodeoxyribonuclease [Clostridiales bacterium]